MSALDSQDFTDVSLDAPAATAVAVPAQRREPLALKVAPSKPDHERPVAESASVTQSEDATTLQRPEQPPSVEDELRAEIEQLRQRLSTTEKLMQDKLSTKNAQLELMRLRSSRLEFAQKEAIHFLSKPLDKYALPENQSQIATKFAKEVVECLRFALQYLRNASQAVNDVRLDNGVIVGADKSAASASLSTIQPPSNTGDEPFMFLPGVSPPPSAHHARSSSSSSPTRSIGDAHMSKSNSRTGDWATQQLGGDLGSPSRKSTYQPQQQQHQGGHSHSSSVAGVAPTDPFGGGGTTSSSRREALFMADDGDGEEDLASSATKSVIAPKTPPACPNCRELALQLDHADDRLAKLGQELTSMQTQMDQERQVHERVQVAKDILETEIEELTAQLFDQANKLVVEEAKLRDELEVANCGLKGHLEEAIKKLGTRETEFEELKRKLSLLDDAKRRSSFTGNPNSASAHSPLSGRQPSGSNVSLAHNVLVDGLALNEFQEFLRIVAVTKDSKDSLLTMFTESGDNKVNNSAFVKRCLTDDVEPCLFNNPNSSGWIKTANLGLKKRLLEAVVHGTCDIRPHAAFSVQKSKLSAALTRATSPSVSVSSPVQSPSSTTSDRTAADSPSSPKKCWSCGVRRDCPFGLKITPAPSSNVALPSLPLFSSDEIYPLDPFCRERIIAVCDFYAWLTRMRQEGVGTRPLLDVFRMCLWHRRRMNEARVGSVGLFPSSIRDKDAMDKEVVSVQASVSIVH
ncbi:hypothetical protein RI367_006126 [Sorochytrium milnesiophthora]